MPVIMRDDSPGHQDSTFDGVQDVQWVTTSQILDDKWRSEDALPRTWAIGGYALDRYALEEGAKRYDAFHFPPASGLATTDLAESFDLNFAFLPEEVEPPWDPDDLAFTVRRDEAKAPWVRGTDVPTGVVAALPYEFLYDALGKRKGAFANRAFREGLLEEWAGSGEQGALWLCERLRHNIFLERQTDAVEALIGVGSEAIPSILCTLSMTPSEGQAEALLKAIRWIGDLSSRQQYKLRGIIRRYLEHRSSLVRIAAAKATSCLRIIPADDLLRYARSLEDDPDVREEIDDLLATE